MIPPEDADGAAGGATPDDANAQPSDQTPAKKPVDGDPSDLRRENQSDADRPHQLALPGFDIEEDDLAWSGPEVLTSLAATRDEFTADAVRRIAGVPGSRNKIGAAFLAAAARGEIVPVGITRSRSRSRHAGKVTVWRGAA